MNKLLLSSLLLLLSACASQPTKEENSSPNPNPLQLPLGWIIDYTSEFNDGSEPIHSQDFFCYLDMSTSGIAGSYCGLVILVDEDSFSFDTVPNAYGTSVVGVGDLDNSKFTITYSDGFAITVTATHQTVLE